LDQRFHKLIAFEVEDLKGRETAGLAFVPDVDPLVRVSWRARCRIVNLEVAALGDAVVFVGCSLGVETSSLMILELGGGDGRRDLTVVSRH